MNCLPTFFRVELCVCFVTKTPFFNWIVIKFKKKQPERERERVNANEMVIKKSCLAFNTVQLRVKKKRCQNGKSTHEHMAVKFSSLD